MRNRKAFRDWWETHLEKPTIAIVFLFLVSLLTPRAYPFSSETKATFKILEFIFWGLFSLEYLIRVYLAKDRLRFIKRHPIDLIIILVPPIRLFHVITTISITAYFLRKARNLFLQKNAWFLLTMAPLMLTVSSVLMYEVESKAKGSTIKSFGDSLWWAITTMSTVGYGDKYPVTNLGKIIATLTIIVGVSLIGMLTAEIAVIFIGTREEEETSDKANFTMVMNKLESMEKDIKDLKGIQEIEPKED